MVENRIKERCAELGVSQKWLSEKSGVPQSTLSEIIHGKQTPDVEAAGHIAFALNAEHIDDIFIVT